MAFILKKTIRAEIAIVQTFSIAVFVCLTVTVNSAARTRAEDLNQLAWEYSRTWNLGSYREAAKNFEAAAGEWEKEGEAALAAACLRESGTILQILSDYDASISSLEKAIDLDRGIDNEAGLAISHSIMSLVLAQRGDNASAERNYKVALEFTRSTDDPAARAWALFSGGMFGFYTRDLGGSMDLLEQSLLYAEKTDDSRLSVKIRSTVGFGHMRQGRPTEAMQFLKAALTISEQSGLVRERALTLFGCGYISLLSGQKGDAISYYKQAEKLYPDDFEWIERGKLYANIAAVFEEFESPELAEINYRKAFESYTRGAFPLGQMAMLPSLAKIQFRNGDKDSARLMLAKATAMAESLGSKLHTASISQMRGDMAFDEGLPSEAINHYRSAESFYRASGLEFPELDWGFARAYERLGDIARARFYFEESLRRGRNFEDKILVGVALYELAKMEYENGDAGKAFELVSDSIKQSDRAFRDVGNANLRLSYSSTIQDRYKLSEQLLMAKNAQQPGGVHMIEALGNNERSRAREFLESLSLSDGKLYIDADAGLVEKERTQRIELNVRAEHLTSLLSDPAKNEEAKRTSTEIKELEDQLENTRGELRQKSPIYSAIKNPEPFNIEDFQANVLDEWSILLEFSLGKEESYLWAVSKTEVSAFYLPSREVIESRVEKLRGLLAQTGIKEGEAVEDYQNRIAGVEGEYKVEARALSDELLGQAVDKFAGKRLIIVADGKLLYFPLGSLPMPGSNSDAPILLTNEVVYEPSASALKILKSERTSAKRPEKNLLVFADPVFSKTDERLTGLDTKESTIATTLLSVFRSGGALEKLPRLPASEEEATSIRDVVGTGQTTVRSGFEANREGVINSDIENYKALHFATHGVIDEKRPELSGIVLSLYDKDGKVQDGGVIRLQDVYGLNLRADLVVLSACETGIGKEVRGEGLMSLNNAFLQAGAKTVVSSLWKVDDTATKQLMTNFYRGIAVDGLTASAALRQAQIAMYKDPRYTSPFHWAAFTVQGDYQRVPGIGGGFPFWIFSFLIVPIGVFGIYRFRRARRQNFAVAR